ncbi:MAG: TRAP transporter small permease subunit [Gammaproteobacteria bacterium]|nr:TRAP transporter small permease subunit [Gammaproteobacteria bacterium]
MNLLIKIAESIDALIDWVGRTISWLTLLTVIIAFLVVVMRDLFEFGRIWIQELYVWTHAMVFMLGAAWTLKVGGHVRVDIVYRKLSPYRRCWVDLLGVLLLLIPTCLLILWSSYSYVESSIRLLEGSRETGGVPGVFILKSVIPLTALLLLLQGVSMAIHNAARIRGLEPIPDSGEIL